MSTYDCFGATAGWFGGSDWGWGAGVLSALVHLLPLILLGLGIWVVWRMFRVPPALTATVTGPSPDGGAGAVYSSARRVLDERYARGELDAEEYRSRRDDLTSGGDRI